MRSIRATTFEEPGAANAGLLLFEWKAMARRRRKRHRAGVAYSRLRRLEPPYYT
jgi:hypothetical protein